MTIRNLSIFSLFVVALFFSACKKTELPEPPSTIISINPAIVNLKRDLPHFAQKLTVKIENLKQGESASVLWSSENPKVARVTDEGVVWAEGAGETYVLATLISGKGVAKCKVVVTDANDYKYRIILKDKGVSNLTVGQPEAFLSPLAITKRLKRNIAIDNLDLPISIDYLKAIQQVGGAIIAKSKWLNTVTVNCSNQHLIEQYKALPFVKDVVLVWEGQRANPSSTKYIDAPQIVSNHTTNTNLSYGSALTNITINNGQSLHQQGFKGAGIDIAVIDAGFINLKQNSSFSNVNIKGAKSFVYENDNPYALDSHGVWVTSTMAVNLPGKYIGTAPEANYWLLRTEDPATEYPVEEDYWVNAAEFADSVGVDIINTSLSYSDYDTYTDYKFENMDGKTAFATRGANVAASKGIFIVCSAGNEGTWVGTPADSPNVLTLGSVNSKLTIDTFSSWGITTDGRMKPDVLALGGGASVIGLNGNSESRSGTSFSSPIMCGLAACLWQAFPKLTNKELLEVIRKSGDKANNPIVPYGYGIANMQKAIDLSKAITASR